MMKKTLLCGAIAVLGLSAAACGRMADLEAPPRRETERAPRSASDRPLPDPATSPRAPSRTPIDGATNHSPFGGPTAPR